MAGTVKHDGNLVGACGPHFVKVPRATCMSHSLCLGCREVTSMMLVGARVLLSAGF